MRYFISLIGLAVIVGAGYFAIAQYTNTVHGQSLLTPANTTTMSASGAQALALLNRIKSLKLDGAVFSNPTFQGLQDWSAEIAPQSISRPNPFLPTYGTAPERTATTTVALPKSKK